jgi:hypothetical protein
MILTLRCKYLYNKHITMATTMQTYLKKALDSKTRKGIRPTKYKIKARWDVLQENKPSIEQYVRITKFITDFYDGFDEKQADAFMHDLHNIMMTDPSVLMESYEHYLKIFKI